MPPSDLCVVLFPHEAPAGDADPGNGDDSDDDTPDDDDDDGEGEEEEVEENDVCIAPSSPGGSSNEAVAGDAVAGDAASSHGTLSAETLRLPGRVVQHDVEVVDARDSQTGSWWGQAYQTLNDIERLQKKQVPMQKLYDMYLMKEVFPGYEGTFQVSDFEHLALIRLPYHSFSSATTSAYHVAIHPVSFTMDFLIHHQHRPT